MKLFNTIWTILLKSINKEKPSLQEISKINGAISLIISHKTCLRVCQLYELLNNSLKEFFEKILKSFESLPQNKLLSSYLSFLQSLNYFKKMMKTLLYPIYAVIPMIQTQTFSSFPCPERLFHNSMRKYFYLPLSDKLDGLIDKEMEKFVSKKEERAEKAEYKLSQYYSSLWEMAISSSHAEEEDNKTSEILKYCQTVLGHFKNLDQHITVISRFVEKTAHSALKEEIERALYSRILDEKNIEASMESFISKFKTNAEEVSLIYHASKAVNIHNRFNEELKHYFQDQFEEKEEKQIISCYVQLKEFINKNYPNRPEFLLDLKSAANILLSKGFGVKAIALDIMKDENESIAAELYNICEVKDFIHTSLLSYVGAALVNGKEIPQKFLQSVCPTIGAGFIHRIKRMISDSKESDGLSKEFMKTSHYQCLRTSIDIHILIATNHVWPLTFVSVAPIECLKPVIVMFVGFYHRKYAKRMIRFLHKSSIYEIQFDGCTGTHTMNHNQTVAMILASEGKLTEEEFKLRVMSGEGTISLLQKEKLIDSENRIIPIGSNVNVSVHKSVAKQQVKEETKIHDYSLAIQAKIVRIMKKTKSATKKQVISMVQSEELSVDSKIIQPYLDELVLKEYLEYDSNGDIYTYVA